MDVQHNLLKQSKIYAKNEQKKIQLRFFYYHCNV